jgi:hypothetical protein
MEHIQIIVVLALGTLPGSYLGMIVAGWLKLNNKAGAAVGGMLGSIAVIKAANVILPRLLAP